MKSAAFFAGTPNGDAAGPERNMTKPTFTGCWASTPPDNAASNPATATFLRPSIGFSSVVWRVLQRRSFLDGGVGLFEASLQQDRATGQAGPYSSNEILRSRASVLQCAMSAWTNWPNCPGVIGMGSIAS